MISIFEPTKWECVQQRLRSVWTSRLWSCPDWSESSQSAWRNLGLLATHWAQVKTGRSLILLVLSYRSSFLIALAMHTINVPKFQKHQKRKNTLNLFSLLTSEAKGSNKFCKGRQFNCFPLQNWLLPSQNFWYYPFRNKDFSVQSFRTF